MVKKYIMATVSVIIPCFNQGIYLEEAVQSVLSQSFKDYEIIIVNDGSTEDETNRIISTIKGDTIKVITTSNQGLAAARNNGIEKAAGTYILPLDADDRIGSHYLEQAVRVLDTEPEVGIVYCRAQLFGAVTAEWTLPPFSIEAMLKDNVIFCAALFRRADWLAVGGYDTGMIYGWEDYDFWLSLIERGRKVKQLQELLFYYRVSADSMVRSKEKWQKIEMFKRIYKRHQEFIGNNIECWLQHIIELGEPYRICQLYIDTGSGFCETESIIRKVSEGANSITFKLDQFKSLKRVRFDPVNCCGVVRLDRLVVYNDGGTTIFSGDDITGNFDCREKTIFMFSENDPQLLISNKNCTIESLSIDFTILSLGEKALRDIVHFQKKHAAFSLPDLFKRVTGKWSTRKTGLW